MGQPARGQACRIQPPSGRLSLLPRRRRGVQRDRPDHGASCPRTSSRPPISKTGRSPPWSLPWPSSRRPSRLVQRTPRTKPPPGSTQFPSPGLSPSPRPTTGRHGPGADQAPVSEKRPLLDTTAQRGAAVTLSGLWRGIFSAKRRDSRSRACPDPLQRPWPAAGSVGSAGQARAGLVVDVLVEQPGGDRAGGSGQGAAQGGGGQQEPFGAGQAGVGGEWSSRVSFVRAGGCVGRRGFHPGPGRDPTFELR